MHDVWERMHELEFVNLKGKAVSLEVFKHREKLLQRGKE